MKGITFHSAHILLAKKTIDKFRHRPSKLRSFTGTLMNDRACSEAEVFEEMKRLAELPGYIHAIAYIAFRDNALFYSEQMRPNDLQKLH